MAATQATTSTATLSHPQEGNEQQDTLPTSAPPVLDTLESCDSGAASATYPVSPALFRVLPLPSTEFIAPLSGTTSPYSTDNATLPHLRAHRLANSVLQLLVCSPPFWKIFKKLGNPKGQRVGGVPATNGDVIPLVDTTTRFIKEFGGEGTVFDTTAAVTGRRGNAERR